MKRRKKFKLKIWKVLPKMEDSKPQVHDPMEEPMITYISSLLPSNLKEQIISLL